MHPCDHRTSITAPQATSGRLVGHIIRRSIEIECRNQRASDSSVRWHHCARLVAVGGGSGSVVGPLQPSTRRFSCQQHGVDPRRKLEAILTGAARG